MLRTRCLRGLQKVSARCGFLPKSYWISYSDLVGFSSAPSTTGRVSSTRQCLMDGRLVAVKTINPDCIENPDAFKRVRRFPSPNHFLSMPVYLRVLAEAVHRRGDVEATKTSECGQLSWVQLQLFSHLPRIPLDVQWEFVQLRTRVPKCQ